jgi:acyl carrier protein
MITTEDILHLVDAAELSVHSAQLELTTPLSNQGFDSLDVATLMVEVETRYKILIPSEKMSHAWSVKDLVDFLNDETRAELEI